MAARILLENGTDALLAENGDTLRREETFFDDARQSIINGLTSAQAEAAGWNAVVRPNIPLANVVRTSATVCTVTLQAQATYAVTALEAIALTLPASALTGGASVVAVPVITVLPGTKHLGIARRSFTTTTVTNAADMPSGQTRATILADWPAADLANPAKTLDMRLEYSTNGGVDWFVWCGFTTAGNPTLSRQPSMQVSNAPPSGALLRLREIPNGAGVETGAAVVLI